MGACITLAKSAKNQFRKLWYVDWTDKGNLMQNHSNGSKDQKKTKVLLLPKSLVKMV